MSGKHQASSKQPKIEFQERAIEQFEFFIPKYVKNPGVAPQRIPAEPHIVSDNAPSFAGQAHEMVLVTAKIDEPNELIGVQLRPVNLVAADEIESNAMRRKSPSQSHSILPV